MVKTMTSKERAYLRGLANRVPSLYQVGKDGVSENMIKQIDDALEARELIKGNVLENSMMSAREVAEELASQTASQVVQVIGNRFVLYRRSKKNLCEM
jgi:RNA-binding protein